MAAKKASRKPGPKPRADAAQRQRQVLFRMQDLYPEFDLRAPGGSASVTAQRDLRRYWTLMNHQLRQSTMKPTDIAKVGQLWCSDPYLLQSPVASVLPTLIGSLAADFNAKSLVGLSAADATAFADLFVRSADPIVAAELLSDLQSG